MSNSPVADNLLKAKLYTFVSNFIAAILFAVVYFYTDSILFLIASILNILVIVFVYFLFLKLEKKYAKIIEKEKSERK